MPTVIRRNSLFILFIAILSACGDAPVYDSFKPIEGGWHQDSILAFDVPIREIDERYMVTLKIRHDASYPYSNLYLFRKIESADGLEYQDTVDLLLADKTGKWLGSGVGEVKTMVWPYRANTLKFTAPGNYTFSLQQGMRTAVLEGVTDVGIEVKVVEEE